MDIFYNAKTLSLQQKKELLVDCKDIAFVWWVDKLDCAKSATRQKVDMEFEEVMNKLDGSTTFFVIDRKQTPTEQIKYFEIGFRTTGTIEYFLWIRVEDKKMQVILDEYCLNL